MSITTIPDPADASTRPTPAERASTAVQTGEEFLESLRDGRNVWIYGERVDDVTTHPAFRNAARSIAGLYDTMHADETFDVMNVRTDTGSGGTTHPFFKVARCKDDLRASRGAITTWQERVFGWMGRSPDYKASLLTALGSKPEYFGEYEPNARRWYAEAQERVLHVGHAIVHPPVDRARPVSESKDVFVHVERETDAGIIVSGAKVVATGSPTAQYVYVSQSGGAPVTEKSMALNFIAPVNGPGVTLLARASYEAVAARAASPFDYPLSSRLDENDSVLIFDQALIPWENVLIYDVDTLMAFDEVSGWAPRAIFQSATRMGVKMDFLVGALSMAIDVKGSGSIRGAQAGLGEVIGYRHAVLGLRDGMIENAQLGWNGTVDPHTGYAFAYAAMAPGMYRRIREIAETVIASGLIYLNSHAIDFDTPEIRPYLDRYLRGSDGLTALDRSQTMKLLWDAIGSEFGSRHELYELNYFGSPEMSHLTLNDLGRGDGTIEHARHLVQTCMDEYDLHGWTTDRFVSPDDVTALARR